MAGQSPAICSKKFIWAGGRYFDAVGSGTGLSASVRR
jgi:hypothetical protein